MHIVGPLKAVVCLALLAAVPPPPSWASDYKRDPPQRSAFMKLHPCPSTGKTRGACPGYVVDHIKPLCAGGRDQPGKLQWQTVSEAKKKDRLERRECRAYRERRI